MRPGGKWLLTMHALSGAQYPNEFEFIEVVRPERIVLRHVRPVHTFQLTATFEDLGLKTRLTWDQVFDSQAEFDRVKCYIVTANEENFDRLEALLKETV